MQFLWGKTYCLELKIEFHDFTVSLRHLGSLFVFYLNVFIGAMYF